MEGKQFFDCESFWKTHTVCRPKRSSM